LGEVVGHGVARGVQSTSREVMEFLSA
jgi:hypothetical protein